MPASIPWPGRSPRGSLVLPLPWSFVPPLAMTFDLPEAPFTRKADLHLTLLSRREADAAATTLPHVTLWTDDAPNGIGIASLADFETKCVRRLTARERQSGIASEKSGTVPDS